MFDPTRVEEYKAEGISRAYRWLEQDLRDARISRENLRPDQFALQISTSIAVIASNCEVNFAQWIGLT